MKSGHPWKLNKVIDGKPPRYPFTTLPELPRGYTWDDISYVIGGYNWKARFIGKDGFIISGPKGDSSFLNQYNFANFVVGNKAGWGTYHSGAENPRRSMPVVGLSSTMSSMKSYSKASMLCWTVCSAMIRTRV